MHLYLSQMSNLGCGLFDLRNYGHTGKTFPYVAGVQLQHHTLIIRGGDGHSAARAPSSQQDLRLATWPLATCLYAKKCNNIVPPMKQQQAPRGT